MPRPVRANPENAPNACKNLRKMLRRGNTITTFGYKWNKRTAYACVAVFAIVAGKIANISGLVADATGYSWDMKGGVWLGGGGAYGLVCDLSEQLYGDGNALELKEIQTMPASETTKAIDGIAVIDCTNADQFEVQKVMIFHATDEGKRLARETFFEWIRDSVSSENSAELGDDVLDEFFDCGKYEIGEGFIAVVRS
jgi:hypothetical protein